MTVLATICTAGSCLIGPFNEQRVHDFAGTQGFDPYILLAIASVESGGDGFFADGSLKCLPEPHTLYGLLRGDAALQAKAVKAGVALEHWDKGFYNTVAAPAQRYAFLQRMADVVGEETALQAASWGLCQVMGQYYRRCGYRSASEMVLAFATHGEDVMVDALFAWLIGANLTQALRDGDYQQIARVYNGNGQVPIYAAKMQQAHDRLVAGAPDHVQIAKASAAVPPVFAMLRLGSHGDDVRAVQQKLSDLGFKLSVDGDFGADTKNAVLAFQAGHAEQNLSIDGVVGPATLSAIQNAAIPDVAGHDPQGDGLVVTPRMLPPTDDVATNAKTSVTMASIGGGATLLSGGIGIVQNATSGVNTVTQTTQGVMSSVNTAAYTANSVTSAARNVAPVVKQAAESPFLHAVVTVMLPMFAGVAMAAAVWYGWQAYKSHKWLWRHGKILASASHG